MINRILIKNAPVFSHQALDLHRGFNVFSGASGSGKSVLMESILAIFGLKESNAEFIEANLTLPFDLEEWGILDEEETIFTILKKEKVRYFINAQTLARKKIAEVASGFVKHVSPKEGFELQPGNLLHILDLYVAREIEGYATLLEEYQVDFKRYEEALRALKKLEEEALHIQEKREFALFEIEKISALKPKAGEYEALLKMKKELSRVEKIREGCRRVESFLEQDSAPRALLQLLERDGTFFESAMEELRAILEEESHRLIELEEVDPASLLERIEKLSELTRRYGSEEEALAYLAKKREEMQHYEDFSASKEALQKEILKLGERQKKSAERLHDHRVCLLPVMEQALNAQLESLRLKESHLTLESVAPHALGEDSLILKLGSADLESVSSGEFNRLRLAILALESRLTPRLGVLILDEIDANLSGEESEGVAKILKELSASYQILAISHQPHMPSFCDRHFLVSSQAGVSVVRELDHAGRIEEIARMISGHEITPEALEFAKKRLSHSK